MMVRSRQVEAGVRTKPFHSHISHHGRRTKGGESLSLSSVAWASEWGRNRFLKSPRIDFARSCPLYSGPSHIHCRQDAPSCRRRRSLEKRKGDRLVGSSAFLSGVAWLAGCLTARVQRDLVHLVYFISLVCLVGRTEHTSRRTRQPSPFALREQGE